MTDIKQHIAEHYDDSDIKLILDRSKPAGHINVASGVQIGFHVQRKRLRIQMICSHFPSVFKAWAKEFLNIEGQFELGSELTAQFEIGSRKMTINPGTRNANWTRIEITVPYTYDPASASDEELTEQHLGMAKEGAAIMDELHQIWSDHETEFISITKLFYNKSLKQIQGQPNAQPVAQAVAQAGT